MDIDNDIRSHFKILHEMGVEPQTCINVTDMYFSKIWQDKWV